MAVKIAINGFGRIGRIVARNLFSSPQFKNNIQLVAVNDLGAPDELAFSFKHDSTHGKFAGPVESGSDFLSIDGQKIACLKISNPAELPWKQLGVDVVLECTGRFTDKESAQVHIKSGAKKVIVSAPAKGVDLTVVMGVNHTKYDSNAHHILSNASCTTNCLAPLAHVIHSKWGIKQGYMTTIHSYTSDQRILDNLHKDPRRARTAATNMIPTTTGAAKAVGEVIPELKGRLDGIAVRVPTPNVSLTDLVATVEKPLTKEELNKALQEASETSLKGILGFCKEPLVSSDFNGNTLSSIVDSECTSVMSGPHGHLVKVCSWYDNETGFSCRMLDLVNLIGSKL
jgi:glyceraldehyde 3-phosphate dehydrogenase